MKNLIGSAAGKALDVALFGVGLVHSAGRVVIRRVTGPRDSGQVEAPRPRPVAMPREVPRPGRPRPTSAAPSPEDVDVVTPAGTTGAAPAYNPDTAESDLHQPGTEDIVEPSTTKRIKSETDILRKAAERNPEG